MNMFHRHQWEEAQRIAHILNSGLWETVITFQCKFNITHYKQVVLKGRVKRGSQDQWIMSDPLKSLKDYSNE